MSYNWWYWQHHELHWFSHPAENLDDTFIFTSTSPLFFKWNYLYNEKKIWVTSSMHVSVLFSWRKCTWIYVICKSIKIDELMIVDSLGHYLLLRRLYITLGPPAKEKNSVRNPAHPPPPNLATQRKRLLFLIYTKTPYEQTEVFTTMCLEKTRSSIGYITFNGYKTLMKYAFISPP